MNELNFRELRLKWDISFRIRHRSEIIFSLISTTMSTLLLNRTDFKNYAREYSNQKYREYSDSSLKRVWLLTFRLYSGTRLLLVILETLFRIQYWIECDLVICDLGSSNFESLMTQHPTFNSERGSERHLLGSPWLWIAVGRQCKPDGLMLLFQNR
jgi:hypothetical protein